MLAVLVMHAGYASAAEEIGSVVSLKGAATITRGAQSFKAKLKDGVRIEDIAETAEKSRAKLLFIDDSVLTLRENTKIVIKEFVYSRDEGGKSIFRLMDGAMRTVVGKTDFEVHTPTSVAAARGTIIDFTAGESEGRFFTTITCLEGRVVVRSSDPAFPGEVVLTAGMTITIWSDEPLPLPERIEKEGDVFFDVPGLTEPPTNWEPSGGGTTPVDINVVFP